MSGWSSRCRRVQLRRLQNVKSSARAYHSLDACLSRWVSPDLGASLEAGDVVAGVSQATDCGEAGQARPDYAYRLTHEHPPRLLRKSRQAPGARRRAPAKNKSSLPAKCQYKAPFENPASPTISLIDEASYPRRENTRAAASNSCSRAPPKSPAAARASVVRWSRFAMAKNYTDRTVCCGFIPRGSVRNLCTWRDLRSAVGGYVQLARGACAFRGEAARMGVGVVAKLHAAVHHRAQQRRAPSDPIADHKEGGAGVISQKRPEDLFRVWAGSVVEAERNHPPFP